MKTRVRSRKEETHERVVRAAARAIRRSGYAGVGVADVMKEAGLTHGGFYAHFKSKTALLVEAADRAGAEGNEHLATVASAAAAGEAHNALVDAYLSDRHLNAPDLGCAIAALGTEIPRQDPEVRRAATRRIKEMIDVIERQMSGWGKPGSHEKAMVTLGRLVGTMVVARAVDDPDLSRALRGATRKFLRNAGA